MPCRSTFSSRLRPLRPQGTTYKPAYFSPMLDAIKKPLRDTLLPRLISGKVRLPEAAPHEVATS